MWGMKTTVIPIIIGNLGLIRKTCEKWTKQVPGNINIDMLQKITLLGTAHILRKTLSIKTVQTLIIMCQHPRCMDCTRCSDCQTLTYALSKIENNNNNLSKIKSFHTLCV